MKKILKVISICFLLAGCVFLFLAKRENRPYEEAKKDRNELQEIIVLEETEREEPTRKKDRFCFFARNKSRYYRLDICTENEY